MSWESMRCNGLPHGLSLRNRNRLDRTGAEREKWLAFVQRLAGVRFHDRRRPGTFHQHLGNETLALGDAFDFDRHRVHCLLETLHALLHVVERLGRQWARRLTPQATCDANRERNEDRETGHYEH